MNLFSCDFELTLRNCVGFFFKLFFAGFSAWIALALVGVYGLSFLGKFL